MYASTDHTVDGWNPAPVDVVDIPELLGFYTSQVVQDFFHQQYYYIPHQGAEVARGQRKAIVSIQVAWDKTTKDPKP